MNAYEIGLLAVIGAAFWGLVAWCAMLRSWAKDIRMATKNSEE